MGFFERLRPSRESKSGNEAIKATLDSYKQEIRIGKHPEYAGRPAFITDSPTSFEIRQLWIRHEGRCIERRWVISVLDGEIKKDGPNFQETDCSDWR